MRLGTNFWTSMMPQTKVCCFKLSQLKIEDKRFTMSLGSNRWTTIVLQTINCLFSIIVNVPSEDWSNLLTTTILQTAGVVVKAVIVPCEGCRSTVRNWSFD